MGASGDVHSDDAMTEYLRCFQGDTIHASCEDYRAAASIDLEHDRADAGKNVYPCACLIGANSFVGKTIDIKTSWQAVCENLSVAQVPGGHFLAEESPKELLELCLPFLKCLDKA